MPTPPAAPKKGIKDPLVERLLDDEDLNDHFAAREELAELEGPRRAAVVEAVIAATSGKTPRTPGIGVLADLGDPRAIEALIALVSHKDEEVREEAVMALGNVESKPEAAVPALAQALSDESEDVRDQAADALAEYASPAAIEPLLAALAKAHDKKRWREDVFVGGILEALAASGVGDSRVVAALVEHLLPDAKTVAAPAFASLAALGPAASGARAALEKLVAGDDPWMAVHARRALIAIGDALDAHAPAIVEALALKDADGSVNAAASSALADLGAAVLPFLDAAMARGKNPALRKAAERVRTKMTSRSRK